MKSSSQINSIFYFILFIKKYIYWLQSARACIAPNAIRRKMKGACYTVKSSLKINSMYYLILFIENTYIGYSQPGHVLRPMRFDER